MGNSYRQVGIRPALAAFSTAALAGLLLLAGCGQGQNNAKTFVVITPGALTIGTGTVFPIFASSSNNSVTWSLNNGQGCPAGGCGTLANPTGTGVNYLPPVSIPGSTMTITVTATSSIDSSVSSSVTLAVFSEYVTISGPAPNSIVSPLTTANFSATVVNDPVTKSGVSWSISGADCTGDGNTAQSCGDAPNSNHFQTVFTAPPSPLFQQITITATALDAPNESASITVTVPKLTAYIYSPAYLPAAFAGVPYSAQTSIVGNTPPYSVNITTPLPSWLTVNVTQGAPGATKPACDPRTTACTGDTITFGGTPPAGTVETTLDPTVTVTDSVIPADIAGQKLTIAVYPQTGTANSMLTGSYAFYGFGFHDGTNNTANGDSQNPVYFAGSFTTDGNGVITGGELDVNDSLSATGTASYSSLGGTYEIQGGPTNPAAQTGFITLVPAGNPPHPIVMAVSLSSMSTAEDSSGNPFSLSSAGHFVEWDDTTGIGVSVTGYSTGIRTSGAIARQATSVLNTTASPVTTSPMAAGAGYAYGFNGFSAVKDFNVSAIATKSLYCLGGSVQNTGLANPSCGPISAVGSIDFGPNGTIPGGLSDIMVGEQHSNPGLAAGSQMDNGGLPDANGRITATINTAVTSLMPDWPSHYAMYAISPSDGGSGGEFYVMSLDSNLTASTLIGEADQQNLANIASTPFSSATPIVNYVNENGAGNYNAGGTNGQDRVILQLFTPAPAGPTAGSFSGSVQFQNLSGTYNGGPGTTATSPVSWSYQVDSSSGRVVPNGGKTITEPCMFLIDTNRGWGIQCTTAQQSGLWQFVPQTATSLNAGIFSYYGYSQIEPDSPLEVGTIALPGVAANGVTTSVTSGYDYTQFAAAASAYISGTEPLEYTGAIIAPSSIQIEAGGQINRSTVSTANPAYTGVQLFGTGSTAMLSTMQGCGQVVPTTGGGFVISPTSFVCVPAGGQYIGIHLFTQ